MCSFLGSGCECCWSIGRDVVAWWLYIKSCAVVLLKWSVTDDGDDKNIIDTSTYYMLRGLVLVDDDPQHMCG